MKTSVAVRRPRVFAAASLALALTLGACSSASAPPLMSAVGLPVVQVAPFTDALNHLNAWETLLATPSASSEAESLAPSHPLDPRLITARKALDEIEGSASNIVATLYSQIGTLNLGLGANPWSDTGLRNWADDLSAWVGDLGLVVGGLSMLMGWGGEDGTAVASVSLLASGGAKLLGNFFGSQTGAQFEQKMLFVDFTRRAYDELERLSLDLEALVEEDTMFIRSLADYRSLIDAALTSTETEKKVEGIAAATGAVVHFESIIGRSESVIARLLVVAEHFCPSFDPETHVVGEVGCVVKAPSDQELTLPSGAASKLQTAAKAYSLAQRFERVAVKARRSANQQRMRLLSGDLQ